MHKVKRVIMSGCTHSVGTNLTNETIAFFALLTHTRIHIELWNTWKELCQLVNVTKQSKVW